VTHRLCVLPFTHLNLRANGRAQVCCAWEGGLWQDDVPFSVYTHSLPAIWSSAPMLAVRRDMIAGKEIPGCDYCHRIERQGGTSKRMLENQEWVTKTGGDESLSLDAFVRRSIETDHRLEGPASYHLEVGNLCNLKCRMCNGLSSSRIAHDSVHSKWAAGWAEPLDAPETGRFTAPGHWFQQREFLLNELLKEPGRLKSLYLVGGEPLLVREVATILETLVKAGVARNVTLCFNTNGTIAKPRWLDLAGEFRQLQLWFSIDGYGRLFEYIRYPAKWGKLVENIESLRRLPNAVCSVSIAAQAYNILQITELFRFLDSIDLPFGAASVVYPHYLRSLVLPPLVRREAAARLRAYAQEAPSEQKRATANALASELDAAGETFDERELREWMVFTNDLDAARNQRLAETDPELERLVAASGFEWTRETRHAAPTRIRTGRSSKP
jgi:MoaA/NifB/PqqE/SkfB family radical SAM enzyme